MTARGHHFVPQCYLRGFLRNQEKAKLFVVDLERGRTFQTGTDNVGKQRDFHAVQVEGLPSDAFETAYSGFEGELAPALRRIDEVGHLRDDNDRALLMNFIAVTAVKNPRLRENFRKFEEELSKGIMRLALATPERWESQFRKAQAAGFISADATPDYEKVREFEERGEYDIEVPTGAHIVREMGVLDAVLPYLSERGWMVLRAPEHSSGFITSDHPVCLIWEGMDKGPPRGYGMKGTQVIFPVSRRIAVSGAFEHEADIERDIDEAAVANLNSLILMFAEQQVYGRDGDVRFRSPRTDRLVRGVDLLGEMAHPKWQHPER
jgi:hypothetical protein